MDPILIAVASIFLITFLFLPPILDGVERKFRALIQSRIGPPTILQTWYDIRKLLVKELKIVRGLDYAFLSLIISLILLILCYIFLEMFMIYGTPIHIVIAIILLSSIHILSLISSITLSNPFSLIGASRAIGVTMVNEIAFLTSASMLIALPGENIVTALFLILLAISIYVGSGRLPYDIHEAEPELASGVLIEFSGPMLALYIYNHVSLRFLQTLLLSILIIHAIAMHINPYTVLLLSLAISIAIYMVFALVSFVLGRSRIDLAVKTLMLIYALLTVLLAVFIWMIIVIGI